MELAGVGQAEKRLERMRSNPAGDWTIDDIEVVCAAYGIDCVSPRRGSHYGISHSSRPEILTIPARKPVKAPYIRLLVAFVDAVKGAVS